MNCKRFIIVLGILLLAVQTQAQTNPVFKNEKDRVSYAMGIDIGDNIKHLGYQVNPDVLCRAIRDVLAGEGRLMTLEEIKVAKDGIQKELSALQAKRTKALGEKNRKEAMAFHRRQKKAPGVVTLDNGLQYKVLRDGTGAKPKDHDVVTVHYRGTLIDNTEVFSSYRTGEPKTFPVNAVFEGWRQGMLYMQTGGKTRFYIPAPLAYGEKGAVMPGSKAIGPNASLILDVELIAVREIK